MVVAAAVAVVLFSIVVAGAGLGMTEDKMDYAEEMRRVHTNFAPKSVTVVPDSGGDFPNLRAEADINSTSYGKFSASVVFTAENIAGSANDRMNLWVAIKTATLSAEQRAAMPDFGNDRLVYVSMAYCDVVFEESPDASGVGGFSMVQFSYGEFLFL